MSNASSTIVAQEPSELDSHLFYCVFADGTQRVVVAEDESISGAKLAVSLAECARVYELLLNARAVILNAPVLSVAEGTGG